MTQNEYDTQARLLLSQLSSVTDGFSLICRTDPCLRVHYHFNFPETVPVHMKFYAAQAYEILELGRCYPDPGDTVYRRKRLHKLQTAVTAWEAVGMIRRRH